MNDEKIENVPGAEMVGERVETQNPGIPSVTKVQVGTYCTLAVPVKLPHEGSPCYYCKAEIDPEAPAEACPERAMIVGHFHKAFKLSAIRDGGDTLILKRLR